MHHHLLLQQCDKRQKQLPIQAVFIQIIRMSIRGGNNRDTRFE